MLSNIEVVVEVTDIAIIPILVLVPTKGLFVVLGVVVSVEVDNEIMLLTVLVIVVVVQEVFVWKVIAQLSYV